MIASPMKGHWKPFGQESHTLWPLAENVPYEHTLVGAEVEQLYPAGHAWQSASPAAE